MIARSWSKTSDLKILARQIQDRFETKSTHLRNPGARNEGPGMQPEGFRFIPLDTTAKEDRGKRRQSRRTRK
jgi:hypothetical protein